MGDEELERRLMELEHRLARLEARLSPPVDVGRGPVLPYAGRPGSPISKGEVGAVVETAAPVPAAPIGPAPPHSSIPLPPRLDANSSAPPAVIHWKQEWASRGVDLLQYQAKRREAAPARGRWEEMIGLKWTGWVGAIVLAVGAALAVKFAYDQGWWQGLPPAMRLGGMSLAGVLLLAAGEWVYRRINVTASASLFGAGIAIFFVVSYAGNAYYALYGRGTALTLMATSTLIGAGMALRGNMVSIAVLALLGGNIAPLILRSQVPNYTGLLGYMLMLEVVALCLTALHARQGKWWILRGLSLATTTAWSALILLNHDLPSDAVLFGFFVAFAALYHGELVLSAGRMPVATVQKAGAFAILVTAAFITSILRVTSGQSAGVRGGWVIGTCAVMVGIAALLVRGMGRRRQRILSSSYWLAAGGLLLIAVPVMLKGVGVPLGWGVMGLCFAAYGAIAGVPRARKFAIVYWGLSLLGLLCHGTSGAAEIFWFLPVGGPRVWVHAAGVDFYDTTIVGFVLALIGHAIAALSFSGREIFDRKEGENAVGIATAVVADLVWAMAAIGTLPELSATLSLVVFASMLAAADVLDARPRWALHAMGILLATTVKWAVADMLIRFWAAPAPGIWAAQYAPVVNPLMGTGLLLAVSMVAVLWLRRRRVWSAVSQWLGIDVDAKAALIASGGIVIGVIVFGLSAEIERAVELAVARNAALVWRPRQLLQLGWTILWTLGVSSFVGLAYFVEKAERRDWIRRPAAINVVLAVKFLLIDALAFYFLFGTAPAMVGANLQTLAALIVVGGLVLTWFVSRSDDKFDQAGRRMQFAALALASLVLLCCGTLEIDRACERMAVATALGVDARLVKQVAWSAYWSVFAIACVAVGFAWRTKAPRYFGLALFGITLLKVVVVDLSRIGRGYRILSFMAVGLLLIGTSVLYGKLTPRFEGEGRGMG